MSATTTVGPVSGIDYGALITGLTAVDQAGITAVTNRITSLQQQDTALTTLNTLVTGLKISSASFLSSSIFRATSTNSSNSGVLTATGGVGSPTGNYSFSVQRLASASQQVTQGFASSTAALGLSGTFTIQTGGGQLTDVASLAQLNGGSGVSRGAVRITDASGASSVVDLSNAVDVNDVVTAINSASGVSVNAKISGDHLVITDTSGGSGSLRIANTGTTTTASDLGLAGTATGTTLTGTSLTKISAATSLDTLNDGNGVRRSSLPDFTVQGATGGPFTVSLGSAKTVGDVIKAINSAGSTAGVTAAVSADGSGITLSDANGGPITVNAQNGSLAAYDLGLTTGTSSGSTLVGDRIADVLSGPLLRDLNGGNQGAGSTLPTFGTISINGQSIDLTNARSLQDVIAGINTNTQGVTASINNSGTGITLTSNSSTNFTVADGNGNLASFLHIAGTSTPTATGSQLASTNLRLRYISNNTLLSTLNGGTGVTLGKIQVSDGTNGATVDLSSGSITTIGDVINAINHAGVKVAASINSTGDGILLTQTGGTGTASISDTNGGKSAAQLGIAGNFTNGTLNGSFQKTITISSSDSLNTIATNINNLGIGAAASVINDGSSGNPFRLSISSRNSGQAGRLVIDDGNSGLTTTSLVQGQNAVVVYGGNSNGTGGLLTTSSTNSITGLIPSLTLNLTGVGQTTVSVTNDTSKISDAVQSFVDSYNKVISNIADATKFDQNNAANNGILFGNSTVQQVSDALGAFVNQSYSGYGSVTSLASIGITVGQDGTLSLNTDTLNSVLATDPTDVQNIFTKNVPATAGGAPSITSATTLNSLTSPSTFPQGHISITDGNGVAHDIDLSSAATIGDVIKAINNGSNGTITAAINGKTLGGIVLTQVGGSGTPSVSEVNGGTSAAALHLKGTFTNGTLDGEFPPTLPTSAVKGIGASLSDLVTRFSDAQTGVLFDASTALQTQEQQLTNQQNSLSTLLASKKQLLLTQFANLESTIAGLQAQGSAISSLAASTATTSSSSTKKTG
ncbi:MAG TPA: flagellar filament capping protein FliD [Phycisphaerae bacterium]|nr:flagellar filament capping protein FliD [Phycisphaerae bacterium]